MDDLVQLCTLPQPEEVAVGKEQQQQLRALLEDLPPKEQAAVELHNGIGVDHMSLSDIGCVFEVYFGRRHTREEVRKYEARGLRKLREAYKQLE